MMVETVEAVMVVVMVRKAVVTRDGSDAVIVVG